MRRSCHCEKLSFFCLLSSMAVRGCNFNGARIMLSKYVFLLEFSFAPFHPSFPFLFTLAFVGLISQLSVCEHFKLKHIVAECVDKCVFYAKFLTLFNDVNRKVFILIFVFYLLFEFLCWPESVVTGFKNKWLVFCMNTIERKHFFLFFTYGFYFIFVRMAEAKRPE